MNRGVTKHSILRAITSPRRVLSLSGAIAAQYVQARPRLKTVLTQLVARFPRLYQGLRSFAFTHRAQSQGPNKLSNERAPTHIAPATISVKSVTLNDYPVSVRQAYQTLLDARRKVANGDRAGTTNVVAN